MTKLPLLVVLTLTLTLAACGSIRESRLNPFNWFGRSQAAAPATLAQPGAAVDTTPLVAQVVSMSVEPLAGGAIVRATGLSPTQGYWAGELVPRPLDENGRLVFDFRLAPPPEPKRVSTEFSRQVSVAAYLSDIKLSEINEIVVQGQLNARSSAR
jgi:hypothetical protein